MDAHVPGARNAAGEPEDARPGVAPEVADAVEGMRDDDTVTVHDAMAVHDTVTVHDPVAAHDIAAVHDTVTLPLYRLLSRSRTGVCTRMGFVFALCAAVLVPIVFYGWAYGQVVLVTTVAAGLCFGEFVGWLVAAFVRGSKEADFLEISAFRLRVLTSTWHGPEVLHECDRDGATIVELRDRWLTVKGRSGGVLSRMLSRRHARWAAEHLVRYGWLERGA